MLPGHDEQKLREVLTSKTPSPHRQWALLPHGPADEIDELRVGGLPQVAGRRHGRRVRMGMIGTHHGAPGGSGASNGDQMVPRIHEKAGRREAEIARWHGLVDPIVGSNE